MGWISWLCPGINLKRWLLLFAVGVLLCALGLALFFNYQLMGKAEELLFQMTYLTTGPFPPLSPSSSWPLAWCCSLWALAS